MAPFTAVFPIPPYFCPGPESTAIGVSTVLLFYESKFTLLLGQKQDISRNF